MRWRTRSLGAGTKSVALQNNKSLGQHWLKDPDVLADIADQAEIDSNDTVLEIGPGLGTLTSRLLARAKNVVAVEFDESLARKLPGQFPGKNLEVVNQDILKFNLLSLPADYKVVANVPYYITSKIIKLLSESVNPPSCVVLLIQKEVAERLAANDGHSVLSIATQVFFEVRLGQVVPAALFTPPPKVDSQVVILSRRKTPQVQPADQSEFFRLVKAGFSSRRKKLRSSLAGGLHLEKAVVEGLLTDAGVSPNARAEDLSVTSWLTLLSKYAIIKR